MRSALVWLFALATATHTVLAQTDQTVDSSQAVRTYSLMREDEDWSFLKDPSLRHDFSDPVKYIRVGPQGWFLTIGGEAREAFEQVGPTGLPTSIASSTRLSQPEGQARS